MRRALHAVALVALVAGGAARAATVSTTGPRHMAATDPYVDKEWWLKRMDVFRAWQLLGARGMPDVTIAACDDNINGGALDLTYGTAANRQVLVSGETFTIAGDGTARLRYPPDKLKTITITVDGTSRTPTFATRLVGQSSVTEYTGDMTFNVADAGKTGTASYYDVRARNMWTGDWIILDRGEENLSHGASVAAVINATANGDAGVAGAVPNARLIYCYTGPDSSFTHRDGWKWAANHAERGKTFVLSSSVGQQIPPNPVLTPDVALRDGAQYVYDAGGLMFQAATNNNVLISESATSTANYPQVVLVGAAQENDDRWVALPGEQGYILESYGSNYGPRVSLVGPGANLFTSLGSNLGWFGHTSAATPAAASSAALALSANPDLTNEQLRSIVLTTADPPFGSTTFKADFPNAGLVNGGKATTKALSTLAPSALATRFPQHAGKVAFPYFQAHKNDGPWARRGELPWTTTTYASQDPGDGAWSLTSVSGGAALTKITGPVKLDITGYAGGAAVSGVELWLGTTKLYDGPPAMLSATATYTGGATAPVDCSVTPCLTVVAKTATDSTSETYTDVLVTTLDVVVPLVPSGLPLKSRAGTPGTLKDRAGNPVAVKSQPLVMGDLLTNLDKGDLE